MRNVLRPHRQHAGMPPTMHAHAEAVHRRRSAAAIVADAFSRAGIDQRARIVDALLASVGSLALAVVAGGAFARHAHGGNGAMSVRRCDPARVSAVHVHELARYVEQSHPQRFAQLLHELVQDVPAGPGLPG